MRTRAESPGRAIAITPNDSADLTVTITHLVVGTGGAVSVILANDSAAVTLTLPAGVHPMRVKRVRSTGTTAANLSGLY